jgi:hypothetical protein
MPPLWRAPAKSHLFYIPRFCAGFPVVALHYSNGNKRNVPVQMAFLGRDSSSRLIPYLWILCLIIHEAEELSFAFETPLLKANASIIFPTILTTEFCIILNSTYFHQEMLTALEFL